MPLSLDFHIFSGNVTEKCEVLEWGRENLRIDLGKCGIGPGAGLKKNARHHYLISFIQGALWQRFGL